MSQNQAIINALRTLAYTSISGTYAAVGTAITLPVSIFRIVNTSDADMIFSIDGITDQLVVPTSTFVLYDIAANRGLAEAFSLSGNLQFYVKQGAAPTKGAVYIESISPNVTTPSLFA